MSAGWNLHIDDAVREAQPGIALGAVVARIAVAKSPLELIEAINLVVANVLEELTGQDLASLPRIAALRQLYRGLGKDPTRYRGSSEALLRRNLGNKGMYFINNVVDVCNLVSLQTRQALGAYDLDCLRGPVSLRAARAGEKYAGIGRGELNLEGLPVFCDDGGPFGSPTSDSERTMITPASKRIALVIISCTGPAALDEEMRQTAELLRRYAGAAEISLTASSP